MKLAARTLLGLAALALAFAAGQAGAKDEGFSLMPMDQVEKLLGKPGVAFLDANIPELWEKHRLPGAVHITGRDLAPLLPADKGTQLVFYCSNPK
jgi:hypothetical protein